MYDTCNAKFLEDNIFLWISQIQLHLWKFYPWKIYTWAGCACGQTQQRQTDDFNTCQLLCISMLLHAYYYCTGFHSWHWTVSSWRLSDVNHLLLGYKVSQASQGKLCAHPEEFLYRKIKAFWAWLYNCDSIHKCKNHDFFSEWFDFVLQKLCPMQYCLCSTVASPFSTTGVLAEKLT